MKPHHWLIVIASLLLLSISGYLVAVSILPDASLPDTDSTPPAKGASETSVNLTEEESVKEPVKESVESKSRPDRPLTALELYREQLRSDSCPVIDAAHWNAPDDIFAVLNERKSPSLREFISCRSVNDRCIGYLTRFPLTLLNVRGTKVTPACIESISTIKSLKQLEIDHKVLDADRCRAIASLPNLTKVAFISCGLNRECLRALSRHKFSSMDLDLNPEITDDAVSFLKAEPLIVLEIGESAVSDQGMADLAKIKSLRKLILYRCPVTDRAMPLLGGMPQLEYLDLTYTKIDDRGLEGFDPPRLRWLNVRQCPVAEESVKKYSGRHPQCIVVWQGAGEIVRFRGGERQ